MQVDFLRIFRNRMETFTPSSTERSGVDAAPVSLLVRHLSEMRRLSFLLLLMITLFKQQVSGMVFMIIWKPPQILMTLKLSSSRFDIYNDFNTTCVALTRDVLSGYVSRDYVCDLKQIDVIDTCVSVSNMFGYFQAMRTCHRIGSPSKSSGTVSRFMTSHIRLRYRVVTSNFVLACNNALSPLQRTQVHTYQLGP
jgi:hypothetical protein